MSRLVIPEDIAPATFSLPEARSARTTPVCQEAFYKIDFASLPSPLAGHWTSWHIE
jgi:hypothetical protein